MCKRSVLYAARPGGFTKGWQCCCAQPLEEVDSRIVSRSYSMAPNGCRHRRPSSTWNGASLGRSPAIPEHTCGPITRSAAAGSWIMKLPRYLVTMSGFLLGVPARLLVACVCCYQFALSPLLGRNCRFSPTCSEYFIQAVKKYGALRGGLRGLRRICRCHPWNPGGLDPP